MCCAAVEVLFVVFVFHSQDRNLESFALLQHFAVMTEVVGGREQLRKLDEHLLTRINKALGWSSDVTTAMRSRDRLGAWCCCDLVGLGWNALRGFGEASETAVRETADHRHQRVEVLQRAQTLKKKQEKNISKNTI